MRLTAAWPGTAILPEGIAEKVRQGACQKGHVWEIKHIPRDQNRLADQMANKAIDNRME